MKINRIIVAVSVFVLIFGGVYLSKELGWWKTRSSGAGSGRPIFGSSYESGAGRGRESEDEHDEEEEESLIAGSTTIKAALAMGITEEELRSVIGEYSDQNMTVREAASINGLSFGRVKTALAYYIDE
jgi:DNA-directed RNA polymerase specialized sigma24 family protein